MRKYSQEQIQAAMAEGRYGDLPVLLTSTQAQDATGVCYKCITALCESGNIRGGKVGKAWRINRDSLLAYFGFIDGKVVGHVA